MHQRSGRPLGFNSIRRNPLASYAVLAYIISWAVWSPLVATAQGWVDWNVPGALYYFGPYGPPLSAVIVTAITRGGAGLRDLLRRILLFRVGFRYYVFAVLVPIGLFLLASLVIFVVTGAWPALNLLGEADYL